MGDTTNSILILRYSSYASLALAGALLLLAIVLFFKLRIRDVIFELRGKAKIISMQKMTSSYYTSGSLRSGGSTGETSAEIAHNTEINQSLIMTAGLKKHPQQKSQKLSERTSNSGQIASMSGETEKNRVRQPVTKNTGQGLRMKLTKEVILVHTNERLS